MQRENRGQRSGVESDAAKRALYGTASVGVGGGKAHRAAALGAVAQQHSAQSRSGKASSARTRAPGCAAVGWVAGAGFIGASWVDDGSESTTTISSAQVLFGPRKKNWSTRSALDDGLSAAQVYSMDLATFRARVGVPTRTKLAEITGLSLPTISRIEAGLSRCSIDSLERLRRWIAEAGVRAGIPASEWPDRDTFARPPTPGACRRSMRHAKRSVD